MGMHLEPLEDSPGVLLVRSRGQRLDKALQTARLDRLLEDAQPARVLIEEYVPERSGVVAFMEADGTVVFPLNCLCSCWFCLFEEVADHLRPRAGSSLVDAGGVVVVRGPLSLNAPGSTIDFLMSPPLLRGISSRV